MFNFQLKSLNLNNKILFLLAIRLIFPLIFISLSALIKTFSRNNREKTSPFECGFDPEHKIRRPFSLRFFIITILFLIFDVEATIMIPLPFRLPTSPLSHLLPAHRIIFLILSLGLAIE